MSHEGALMTKAASARFLGVSKDTLYSRLMAEPRFPRPVSVPTVAGPVERFRRADLERWVEALEESETP